ncbi:MAG: hypothetical protein DI535_06335 [Citrobacter freundii]|nr:MAG: hypothetical protein DI535_06335 [Citrobacter freundii]
MGNKSHKWGKVRGVAQAVLKVPEVPGVSEVPKVATAVCDISNLPDYRKFGKFSASGSNL